MKAARYRPDGEELRLAAYRAAQDRLPDGERIVVRRAVRRLMKIPGIGEQTALDIVGALGAAWASGK